MKKIYKTQLAKEGACDDQIELFNKHYPKGIYVCSACFEDAQNFNLYVWWLTRFIDPAIKEELVQNEKYSFLVMESGLERMPSEPYFLRRLTKKDLGILTQELLKAPQLSRRKTYI